MRKVSYWWKEEPFYNQLIITNKAVYKSYNQFKQLTDCIVHERVMIAIHTYLHCSRIKEEDLLIRSFILNKSRCNQTHNFAPRQGLNPQAEQKFDSWGLQIGEGLKEGGIFNCICFKWFYRSNKVILKHFFPWAFRLMTFTKT